MDKITDRSIFTLCSAIIIGCLIFSCGSPGDEQAKGDLNAELREHTVYKDSTNDEANAAVNSAITYEIIEAPEGTFGYKILVDGKVVIHQINIPGMPGLKGFRSEEDALKVAGLVIGKLSNNEMPPTVTSDELKALGVAQ